MCTYVFNITDSKKKKKKMIVNVIMGAFIPKYACHFLLAYF